mmetsp:Transcript_5590/g.21602  ORF Transcript_5590/g.21602 Transcript_5590/m.21602 type:complete len:243 (-) Transcript_5590:149-877(-)
MADEILLQQRVGLGVGEVVERRLRAAEHLQQQGLAGAAEHHAHARGRLRQRGPQRGGDGVGLGHLGHGLEFIEHQHQVAPGGFEQAGEQGVEGEIRVVGDLALAHLTQLDAHAHRADLAHRRLGQAPARPAGRQRQPLQRLAQRVVDAVQRAGLVQPAFHIHRQRAGLLDGGHHLLAQQRRLAGLARPEHRDALVRQQALREPLRQRGALEVPEQCEVVHRGETRCRFCEFTHVCVKPQIDR